MKSRAQALVVPLLLLLLGCGSTRIISQDSTAEIYVNDDMVGVGEARVDRVGPPRRVSLEARKGSIVVGRQEMRRSFRFMTVVWGICSYYTGFYWGWYFPDEITIPVSIAATAAEPMKSPWQDPRQSVWMLPLK